MIRHRIRTSVLVSLGVAGWLALAPATAEAQRGRAIAQAAVNNYLNGAYGGYRGGYGSPRFYGGYTTAYGNGNYGGYYGGGYPVYGYNSGGYGYGGYPVYGYNNGGYGYGYGGGFPAYGYGIRGSTFGNAMLYGSRGFPQGSYFDR